MLPRHVGPANVDRVRDDLLAVIERGPAVLIADMTETRSCDHLGAEALARVYQRAVHRGVELRLVIAALDVRRGVAVSGLDRLVPVFAALDAAQAAQLPLAAVLPLHPPAARTESATPARASTVTRLPVFGPVQLGLSHDGREDMSRSAAEDALSHVTGAIFHAGHTLQDALYQPAAALRQAAAHVLELLDDTVRDARAAAFDRPGHSDGAVLQPGSEAVSGLLRAVGEDMVRLSRLRVRETTQSRARSQQARARALELAAWSAATQERIAATLRQAAASSPQRAADLRALSQGAASRAAQIRQWAHEHAATG